MAISVAMFLGLALFASLICSNLAIQIKWAGRTWNVRTTGSGTEGPGPNYFSDTASNVMVDATGKLRLQVTKTGRNWACAEVMMPASLGYGTYQWTVTSGAGSLDPNVVFGLFTWDDNPIQAHREIDIEFARWGATPAQDGSNAQWVVQPYDGLDHLQRWLAPPVSASSAPLVVSFRWAPGAIYWSGSQSGKLISTKDYAAADVPVPGAETVHMNLWVYQANPNVLAGPQNGKTATVVLSNFTFTPL